MALPKSGGPQTPRINVKFGADPSGLAIGLHQAKTMIGGWAKGVALTTAAAFGAMITKQAIQSALRFGDALAEVNSIARLSQKQIKGLGEELKTFSIRFGRDVVSESKAAYEALSSGIPTAKLKEFLDVSNRLATGGVAELPATVKLLTATLNAYQKPVSEAARVSDIFFKTVELGVTTIPELAAQFGDVATALAQTRTPLEVGTAALATLTKAGVNTAESVTALNMLLMEFLSPSSQAAQAAKKLGLDMSEAGLATKGLPAMLQEIAKATSGSATELSKLFPNIRSLKAAMILTGPQGTEFARILDEITKSANSTAAAFETMQTPAQALRRTMAALNVGLVTAGEGFLKGFFGDKLEVKEVETTLKLIQRITDDIAINARLLGQALEATAYAWTWYGDAIVNVYNKLNKLDEWAWKTTKNIFYQTVELPVTVAKNINQAITNALQSGKQEMLTELNDITNPVITPKLDLSGYHKEIDEMLAEMQRKQYSGPVLGPPIPQIFGPLAPELLPAQKSDAAAIEAMKAKKIQEESATAAIELAKKTAEAQREVTDWNLQNDWDMAKIAAEEIKAIDDEKTAFIADNLQLIADMKQDMMETDFENAQIAADAEKDLLERRMETWTQEHEMLASLAEAYGVNTTMTSEGIQAQVDYAATATQTLTDAALMASQGIAGAANEAIWSGKLSAETFKNIAKSITGTFLQMMTQMLVQHIIMSLIKKKVEATAATASISASAGTAAAAQFANVMIAVAYPANLLLAPAMAMAAGLGASAAALAAMAAAAGVTTIAQTPVAAEGGIISRPRGEAIPITAHGQEMILNERQQARLFELAEGASGRSNAPVIMNFNIDAIDSDGFERLFTSNKFQKIMSDSLKNSTLIQGGADRARRERPGYDRW